MTYDRHTTFVRAVCNRDCVEDECFGQPFDDRYDVATHAFRNKVLGDLFEVRISVDKPEKDSSEITKYEDPTLSCLTCVEVNATYRVLNLIFVVVQLRWEAWLPTFSVTGLTIKHTVRCSISGS